MMKKSGCSWRQTDKNTWTLSDNDVYIKMMEKDGHLSFALELLHQDVCDTPKEKIMQRLNLPMNQNVFHYSVINTPLNKKEMETTANIWRNKLIKIAHG